MQLEDDTNYSKEYTVFIFQSTIIISKIGITAQ